MARIARLTPDRLDAHQRVVYDAIASGPRTANGAFSLTDAEGCLEGPFNAMLLHPAIGDALQQLGAVTAGGWARRTGIKGTVAAGPVKSPTGWGPRTGPAGSNAASTRPLERAPD